MKPRVIKRTLKHWGWNSNFLFSQNASGERGRKDFERLKKEYPEFVELPFWADDFRSVPESHGCEKIVVYAWRWRGEWADPTKEVFARLYKPQKREV